MDGRLGNLGYSVSLSSRLQPVQRQMFFAGYPNLQYSSTRTGGVWISVFTSNHNDTKLWIARSNFFFLHHSQACSIPCRMKDTFLLAQIIKKWRETFLKKAIRKTILVSCHFPISSPLFFLVTVLTNTQLHLALQKGPWGKAKGVVG